MTLQNLLIIVLGLALIAAVATLVVTEVRAMRPAGPRRASAHVTGREALGVIESGLRHLTAQCEGAGRKLPDVYAVGYTEDRLTVRLARADQVAPAPWAASPSGEEWSLEPRTLIGAAVPEAGPDAPPYALVVTIGTDQGERVLVDLSRASAGVAVGGDDDGARKLLRAMLAELTEGPIGRQAEVVLVGAAATAGLADGPAGRLRTVATLEEAVREGAGAPAEEEAAPGTEAQVTQMFRQIAGRRPARAGQGSPRLFVLDAAQLSQGQDVVKELPDSDGLLVVGDARGAALRFRAGARGALDTGALGVKVDTHAGVL
jgi:hypothetical protein